MDSETLRWILLGCFVLACIFYIVLLVLSAKSWRVLHILSALFVFASAATFAVFFALATKTTLAWRSIDAENRIAAEKAKEDVERISYGEPGPEFSIDSLVGVQGALSRELIGRGRVWRGAVGQMQGANLVATLANPPAPADGAAVPTLTIETGSPVYVFFEGELQTALNPAINGIRVPQRYLGEFVTGNVQGNVVELVPSLTFFRPEEVNGAIPLAIYEKMPGDRPDLLVQTENAAAAAGNPSADRQVLMTEIFPPASFGISPEMLIPGNAAYNEAVAERYERLIDEYQFDGMTTGDIDKALAAMIADSVPRVRKTFEASPEETWLLMEVMKDYTLEVDAPNAGGDDDVRRTAVGRGFYDAKGLAISADLRLERDVVIKAGQTILVDQLTAEVGYADSNGTQIESLVKQGVVGKTLATYFFRKLNDYQLIFRELNVASYLLQTAIKVDTEKRDVFQQVLNTTDLQITAYEEEQDRLRSDVDNLTRDVEVAQAHMAKLEALLAARRQKINELFVQTQTLAQRKAELESELVRRIDSATAAATSNQQ